MNDFPIRGLRSVDLVVPDIAAASRFYINSWGLAVAETSPGSVWFHATGSDHHVLALHHGPRAAIRSLTFVASSRAALEAILVRAEEKGVVIVEKARKIDEPGGGYAADLEDVAGRRIRIIHGDATRIADAPSADRPERLAHVNINSRDVARDIEFYETVLGFRLTDRSKMMAFVRTNSDHHSIVIADAAVDTLNHVAFQLPSWEAVMRASGRLADHGFPIGWGPGRHGPGDNVFAYFVDPHGFVVEHTAEVLQVNEGYHVGGPGDWIWPPGRTDQWGIAPPKTDACKRAQLAIPFEGQQ